MTLEIRFRRIATNGVTLNVAEAGPLDGPLVILLHGFPESSSGWKAQIGPLAEAGYRVLAPDQRGYAESDKPRGIAAYALDVLVEDLIGLIDSEGRKRASVVGHDWGGRGRLGGDCPPPLAIRSGGDPQRPASRRDGPRGPIEPIATPQKLVCHRLPAPVVARDVASSERFRWLVRTMTGSSRPGTFTGADFERYRRGWSSPGALTSMVNWYRAGLRIKRAPFSEPLIGVSTLVIWGEQDRFLGKGLARSSFAACEDARLLWIPEATHWVQLEEPERVNRAILEWLAEGGPASTQSPGRLCLARLLVSIRKTVVNHTTSSGIERFVKVHGAGRRP